MKKGTINVGFNPRKMGFSGETALVAKVDRYSTISYADIISYASKAAAVPESSMTMAMEAIFDAMSYFVLNGHSVQIPNLGTFSITVRCKASDSLEDFTADFASNLRNVVIRFLPSPELKADLTAILPELNSMKNAGVDLVFLPIYYTPASNILIQADKIGYAPTFFGVDGMDGILTLEGFDTKLAEGVMLLI